MKACEMQVHYLGPELPQPVCRVNKPEGRRNIETELMNFSERVGIPGNVRINFSQISIGLNMD